MKKPHTLTILSLLIFSALSIGTYVHINREVNTNTFYSGIKIDEIDLGGLTREAAFTLLNQANRPRLEKIKIKIEYGSEQWIFGYKDIQAYLDIDKILDQAYVYGRDGSILKRYLNIRTIKNSGYSLKTDMYYNLDDLSDKLKAIDLKYHRDPVNAAIRFEPDGKQKFFFTSESYGLHINTSGILEKIDNNLSKKIYDMTIKLTAEKIVPSLRVRDFTGKTEKIVTFGTDLSRSSPNRTHNILQAASAFNGMVVQPGQTVSFNATTGIRSTSKGYKYAPMIQNNRFIDVPGGGVSQTSTTLYNTVIRAGLEVLEWRRHSIPSSYIELGLDTTVNLPDPEIDLKFKNTKQSPVYIRSFYENKKVYFEIYGEPLPNHGEIRFHSELYETVPAPNPSVIKDTGGKYVKYEGQQHKYRDSRPGYKVRVHKETYENRNLVSRSLFDQHYYLPIKGLIHIGVGKNE